MATLVLLRPRKLPPAAAEIREKGDSRPARTRRLMRKARPDVASMILVRCEWSGYDPDGCPTILLPSFGPQNATRRPPLNHRDNYNRDFAFACYHRGRSLPQARGEMEPRTSDLAH